MVWLEKAAKQPGKALAVGVLIWFRFGILKKASFTLPQTLFARFGVGRKAAYHALTVLEEAGLIHADRGKGRLPRITILEIEKAASPDVGKL